MANLKDVIYLSAEDYNTLYINGTVTINGTTLTYDANNVYIVPDDTDAKISTALADYIAKSNTTGLVKNDGTIDTNAYATTSQLPSTMVASGSSHSGGLVPDTPSTAGNTKFLREDGTWQNPTGVFYKTHDGYITNGEKLNIDIVKNSFTGYYTTCAFLLTGVSSDSGSLINKICILRCVIGDSGMLCYIVDLSDGTFVSTPTCNQLSNDYDRITVTNGMSGNCKICVTSLSYKPIISVTVTD